MLVFLFFIFIGAPPGEAGDSEELEQLESAYRIACDREHDFKVRYLLPFFYFYFIWNTCTKHARQSLFLFKYIYYY